MSWTNYHCHTPYCDGQSEMEALVLEAIRNKDAAIGFSAHGPVPFASEWNISKQDLVKYYEVLKALKEKYHGQIAIFTGIEADFIEGQLDARSDTLLPAHLDYKISSLHYVGTLDNGTPWAVDTPWDEWETGLQQIYQNNVDTLVKDFARQSIQMMELGGFDIVGHLDKIFQNGHQYFDHTHAPFRSAVKDMLHAAKENDLIVEINTKSFESLGFFYPHQSFFSILKQLSIPVTINTDAHSTDRLHSGMAMAAEYLLANGISETVEFINGEWKHCQLTKNGIQF